jgi:RNA polymerase sigma-70 factor (sigma-E family)
VTGTVTAAEFDGFYETHFGDTVAMTYRLTSDIDEARDIAQEAFCRAWHSWQRLSDYDNPITWVRRVATNLAYSRWRHLRVATAHLARHKADDAAVAPPNLDHITIVAALRKLPRDQCKALVLHHIFDLPVTQIADELEVPVGRVKMWLHRGRHTLSAELDRDVKPSATNGTAPTDQTTKQRNGGQRRRKTAARAAAALLTILAGVSATSAAQSIRRSPPGTQPAAQPARPSAVVRPAVALSWRDDKLTVRWTDPSDGHARPFLLGNGKDGQPQQVAAPARGDTQLTIRGLSSADTYCLTLVLEYTDNSYLLSSRVCTEHWPATKAGRFAALAPV